MLFHFLLSALGRLLGGGYERWQVFLGLLLALVLGSIILQELFNMIGKVLASLSSLLLLGLLAMLVLLCLRTVHGPFVLAAHHAVQARRVVLKEKTIVLHLLSQERAAANRLVAHL